MGKLVHFEIPADDMVRAQKFYEDMFGWKATALPDMKYTIVHTGPTEENGMTKENGFINGGIMHRKDIVGPVVIIDVVSVDEAVKKAESRGSKIIRPKVQVGEMGYVAYITDSEGNIIGVWENLKK